MTCVYPEIKLVYWAGGNPFHHHQDLVRMRQAWQKPDTIVVHEWCWNSLARHADIVLPSATPLERNDIASSSRDPFLVYMEKAIEPVGECRADYDIFRLLARAMGVEEAFTGNRDEEAWLHVLYAETRDKAKSVGIELPEFDEFKLRGWFENSNPRELQVLLKQFRDDPETYPLKTPSGKIEIFSERVAAFGYQEAPGFPFWNEPKEWLGRPANDYRLHLISNQPANKLHSQLDHGRYSRIFKINGREPVLINPEDAVSRGIQDGALVRVYSPRGSCLCTAVLSEDIRSGVLQLNTGAWYNPPSDDTSGVSCLHGNPNVLTRGEGTSRLAQGPSAMSCLVDVEVYKDEAPGVTVFTPPTVR